MSCVLKILTLYEGFVLVVRMLSYSNRSSGLGPYIDNNDLVDANTGTFEKAQVRFHHVFATLGNSVCFPKNTEPVEISLPGAHTG